MNVARIDRHTLVVVNIELGDQAWLDANANDPDFLLVPYAADSPAWIGLSWSSNTGFEQPTPEPAPEA